MHAFHTQRVPGAAPGIEHHEIAEIPGTPGQAHISCIDYCPDQVVMQEVDALEEFVAHHRPQWAAVRWINVDGLADTRAIQLLATKYDLHPLAVEDMFHQHQRPKVETFGGEDSAFMARLFIVTQAMQIRGGHLQHDQVCIFLGHNTVLTFHAGQSTDWNTIRQRIKAKGSRLRSSDAGFLAYSLLDAIVDGCFPILESYSDRAEELEELILNRPQSQIVNQVHQFKRELMSMRWVMWPMRELVASLQREPHECVSENTRLYLRDLYDHVVQIIELIETYREIANDLIETYMSSVSNRMSETMKVLALISTIFIPLTFLAGVYGTNFHHLPELEHEWAYPIFWVVCILMAAAMVWLFRRRQWL